MNPRLRAAIIAARAENMPKDNIERAIKKALGGDAESYEEIRYEGYGPGGVAVIVEVLTDNRNRAAGEVRATFTKSGGNLAETGAVSFMFDHVGVIEYDAKVAERRGDVRSGAGSRRRRRRLQRDDARESTPRRTISARSPRRSKPNSASRARRRWRGGRRTPWRSTTSRAKRCLKLIENLNDNDDVQNVYANFEISDALVSRMSA